MNEKIGRIWEVQGINDDGYFDGYIDRGVISPDEYTEFIRRMDEIGNKGGLSTSWVTYLDYLGIDDEQLEKDRLAPDYDLNKAEWKYYQETLDRMKQNDI